jgi:hypothetical protein
VSIDPRARTQYGDIFCPDGSVKVEGRCITLTEGGTSPQCSRVGDPHCSQHS